jgi:hypothetical protein
MDQIKPVSRILRKRIAEHAPLCIQAHWEINSEDLRSLCLGCRDVVVENDDSGDWAALLVGQPRSFIDVYGQLDSYPAELWLALESHCRGDSGASLRLPGGRYACAVALQARGLPFLAGKTLGEIAHIVQIAISQRKILGYSNGAIVPYSHSQSMMKEVCAKSHCPCSCSSSRDPMLVASWGVARMCLWQILQCSPSGQLPLPNVKRLFRSRFHLDLSETAFGYSKVSELLQDCRFHDICDVELRGHGYVVVQKRPAACGNIISLEEGLLAGHSSNTAVANEVPARCVEFCCEPLPLDDDIPDKDMPVSLVLTPTPGCEASASKWSLTVRNTFIQVKRPPGTPQVPTSRSMPAGLSAARDEEDHTPPSRSEAISFDASSSPVADEERASSGSDEESSSSYVREQLNPIWELLNTLPAGGADHAGACTPFDGVVAGALRTPGKKKSVHRVNFCVDEPLEGSESPLSVAALPLSQLFPMTPFTPFEQDDEPQQLVVRFCVDEPLGVLEPKVPLSVNEANTTLLPTLMTPGTMSKLGFVTSNTFLAMKRQPPTPFRSQEARRSKSVGA